MPTLTSGECHKLYLGISPQRMSDDVPGEDGLIVRVSVNHHQALWVEASHVTNLALLAGSLASRGLTSSNVWI